MKTWEVRFSSPLSFDIERGIIARGKNRNGDTQSVKVTLDTNCFFDYFERNPRHIQTLVTLASKGFIELAMTTRVMADTHDKWKGAGISPIWIKIQTFPLLKTIGTGFRLDASRLDFEDYLVSENDINTLDRLRKVLDDAQVEDIDHLFGHLRDNRDIFITSDHHFLEHQQELKNQFGVVVLKPEDAIKKIRKTH